MKKADVDRIIGEVDQIIQELTDKKQAEKREWIGLDPEQMRNTPTEFNRGALWAERYLKEKNHG